MLLAVLQILLEVTVKVQSLSRPFWLEVIAEAPPKGVFDCFQRTQVLLKFAWPSLSIVTLLAHRSLMIATFTGSIAIVPS